MSERPDPVRGPGRPDGSPCVAHLVTPYLFLTGGWIYSQLAHARSVRPIVITQARENGELFPFASVFDLAPHRRGASALAYQISKYLLGRYPVGPYLNVLREQGVDVLHAHLGWEGARTIPLRRRARLPFVVSFYGRDATMLVRNPYWRALYRRLFAEADRVLAEGPYMAETLRQIGAPADRIRVVHLGVPLEQFSFQPRQLPEGDGPIVGLIAASFREKKGILYGIEAMARIKDSHPRLRLRLVGDGPLRPVIEDRIRTLDLQSRVELLGAKPPAAYRAELLRAHFLLAPSVVAKDGDSEGGAPVCLLDAQATGLPVIATTHCDIPDVTLPEQSALLAPERDVPALAARLDEFLRAPDRWAAMGAAGRAHIEREFDIARQVERTAAIYAELLGR